MDEMINTIITQLPNFVGLVFAIVILWRVIQKQQTQIDTLTTQVITMAKDCDCRDKEVRNAIALAEAAAAAPETPPTIKQP